MEPMVTGTSAARRFDGRDLGIGPLTVDIDSLAVLRGRVADLGRACGMGDTAVGDLVMVANELATNVVRHGGGSGRLSLWRSGTKLVCEVSDDGPGMFNAGDAGAARIEITSLTGRGIWLIRQVADTVDINTDAHGTTVTVAMPIE